MKIILTDDVVGVGDVGQTVNVRAGFARNYLIPQGVAFEAETASARIVSHRMKQVEAKKRKLKGVAEERAGELQKIVLNLGLRVGSGGKVFGSITSRDIAAKLTEAGFTIDRRRVLLQDPLKRPGTHKVEVKLHAEVKAEVTVEIEALAPTKEEEEKESQEAKMAIEQRAAEAQAEDVSSAEDLEEVPEDLSPDKA